MQNTAPPCPEAFATLNAEQRAAVEHGIGDPAAAPLPVIAGAGTGKTTTPASRVARLVLAGADPNRLQAAILKAMKPDGCGLTVVGDDAQAIYAFRAAEVRNILDFPAQFDPPARVITLTRNYRSTQPILDASNAVI